MVPQQVNLLVNFVRPPMCLDDRLTLGVWLQPETGSGAYRLRRLIFYKYGRGFQRCQTNHILSSTAFPTGFAFRKKKEKQFRCYFYILFYHAWWIIPRTFLTCWWWTIWWWTVNNSRNNTKHLLVIHFLMKTLRRKSIIVCTTLNLQVTNFSTW